MRLSFSHLSVRNRLLAGFATVLLLLVVLAVTGADRVNRIDDRLTQINDVNGLMIRHAIDLSHSVNERAMLLRDISLLSDPFEIEGRVERYAALREQYAAAAQRMTATIERFPEVVSAEDLALVEAIERAESQASQLAEEVIQARLDQDLFSARELTIGEGAQAFEAWLASINAFVARQEQQNDANTQEARDIASQFQSLILWLTLAALLLGGGLAYWLARQLVNELGAEPYKVKAFAEAIGRGELDAKASLRPGDDSSMMAAQVHMARQLQEIVGKVRAAANAVVEHSSRIAQGNQALRARLEQQASALAKTASAMEELSGTVRQNADNSRLASDEASSASRTAENGGEAVNQVAEAMRQLHETAQRIATITTTIDSIAFQTNILALNASVEAARAGEHGRGFAIVADEVRKLAARSGEAARDINQVLAGNQERVEGGNVRAEQANRTTGEIVAAIGRVTTLMQEISHASSEQSEGVREVGAAVTEMDRVTQQNVAFIQKNADSARELEAHAEEMLAAVAAFRLPEQEARPQRGQDSLPVLAPGSMQAG